MISDPDRVAASTTTVIVESAAMMRLRAGKHQRWPVKPGGISDTTAPASISRACSPRIRAGYGRLRAAGQHGDGRADGASTTGVAGSAAPSGIAASARVRRRIDPERHAGDDRQPRGGETAAERARDLEPVRRGPARADDRDRLAAGSAASDPATWSTAGGSGSSRRPIRVGRLAAADGGQAGAPRSGAARAAASKRS